VSVNKLLAAAAVMTGLFVGPGARAGMPSSGIHGVLRLSHGCPGPVRVGDTRRCDFPGAGIVVRVFRPAATVAFRSVRTDGAGRFSVALPAGRYMLRADVPLVREQPTPVSVRTGGWTAVTLRYLIPPYMV
jgi:hypothetical protein